MWFVQAIGLWVIVSLVATPFIGRFLAGRYRRETAAIMARSHAVALPQRYRFEDQTLNWDDDDLVAPGIVHLLSWKKAGYL